MDNYAETNEKTMAETSVATAPAPDVPTQEAQQEEERLTFVPAVDIIDGDSETVLLMDVPGVDKDGVEISIEQDILTIKAKTSDEKDYGCELVYAEYRVGDFQRSFSLSEKVNKDGINATVKDGVLKIVLPKMEPVSKKITVSAT